MTGVTQEFSKTLNVCNLICTVLVVAIHFNTKQHIDFSGGLSVNFYIQEVLTNGFARVAVPFFALVSGIFFFKHYTLSLYCYKASLNKRLVSLGIPYVIGASIILITELLYGKVIKFEDVNLEFLVNAILIKPLSVQFWFIRDLIFLALISPLIFLLLNKTKGVLALTLMTLWLFDIEITPTLGGRSIITIEVGAFFVLGAFLFVHQNVIDRLLKIKHLNWLLVTSLVLLGIRVAIDPFMANWYTNNYSITSLLLQNVFILCFLTWLLCYSKKFKDISQIQYFAKFTFFVYLYHLLPLSRIYVKVSDYIISDEYKFYLTFPLAVVATFGVAVFLHKFFSPVYKTLTGGR